MLLGMLRGMLLVKPGKGKLGWAKMLLVVLMLMGQGEGLDLGLESMGPTINHEGLDMGLNQDMGIEQKGMLHMELLQPPMLLYQPMILLRLLLLSMDMELSKRKLGLRNNGIGYATISTSPRYAYGSASSS
jgi:hypothetical protein